ncbi:MAG: PQQ-dependent sugar dehydrogenase, partial [Verrucomicrobia bacterium]|nr:PQQ-dependent sugar dehydrogenase [Verrucomicrobiota bacterium]
MTCLTSVPIHHPGIVMARIPTLYLTICTMVAMAGPTTLRVANPAVNVPPAPPAMAIGLSDAFPALVLEEPTCLASPPGATKRLFVCQKRGLLRVIPDVTVPAPQALACLDLRAVTSRDSECGLLGIAFHPDYSNNRHVYVYYSAKDGGLQQRVSRFTAQADNPDAVDAGSELILISQSDKRGNHNGGDLHFGPDGYL